MDFSPAGPGPVFDIVGGLNTDPPGYGSATLIKKITFCPTLPINSCRKEANWSQELEKWFYSVRSWALEIWWPLSCTGLWMDRTKLFALFWTEINSFKDFKTMEIKLVVGPRNVMWSGYRMV